MNKLIKLIILSLGMATMFLGSCQVEVVDITNPQNENVINSQSPLADLVQNTSMNDGSYDNIIDNSSCTAVVLPVSVIANGQELTINSQDDYILIERIFDESATDVDELVIVYPITVIMADFTEVIVENQDDFDDLIEDCIENGEDLDIECIDFVYPITISVYDSLNQVSDVFIINNDEDLYNVFASLDSTELASFTFPITLILSDSTEVTVTNNEELENLIEEVEGQCDEDDDNDYSDDDIDDNDLVHIIMDGSWDITTFIDKGDSSTMFNGYEFTFFENGNAKAMYGDVMVDGSWHTYGDDGILELELEFNEYQALDELEEDWTVIEFDEGIIRLKDENDDGEDSFLIFEQHNNMGGGDSTSASLSHIIIEGEWVVANYSDSSINKTENYQDFKLTFANDSTVTATNGTDIVNGVWAEIMDDEDHKLELDFGVTIPFDKFNEDWEVLSFTETRVELKDISEGDGSIDILVFEKL